MPLPRFFDLVNHWFVEVFIIGSSVGKEHQEERTKLNNELIGHLGTWKQERSPRGARRPDWFQDVTMDDIDQMARVMPTRRKAP